MNGHPHDRRMLAATESREIRTGSEGSRHSKRHKIGDAITARTSLKPSRQYSVVTGEKAD
jgi:hypothetical protein